MNNKELEICAVCKVVTRRKCSGCGAVYYCSRDHQISDWKFHSKKCFPIKLVVDPTVGRRRYIATRKIEIDELIMHEDKPLLTLPPISRVSCLNCHVELTMDVVAKECKKCGWHLCLNCNEHGPECELTLKYRKEKVKIDEYLACLGKEYYLYPIIIMRALALREENPEAYQRFMRHEDHCTEEAKRSARLSRFGRKDVAKLVKEYMNIVDVDEGEIERIIRIVEINCDTVFLSPKMSVCVFDESSYFEHCCRANTHKSISNEGATSFRASMTIQKGQPITTCYNNNLRGTAERRRDCEEKKYFSCSCVRCSDPTEFGTMFNAVKCIKKECEGYMLPPTFLVSNEETIPDFVCDKCNATMPSRCVELMIKDASEEYAKINKKSVMNLKKFISKRESIFHENHHVLVQAKFDLTVEIGDSSVKPFFTHVELLEENIMMCKKLTRLYETLAPGQYFCRGMSLLSESKCMVSVVYRIILGKTEMIEHTEECKEILTKTSQLFRHETLAKKSLKEEVLESLNFITGSLNYLKALARMDVPDRNSI